jgi:predicted metal-binding membrane protein
VSATRDTIGGFIRHERAVVTAALFVLALLAWSYLWRGADMGMSALEMTRLTLFPHAQTDPMPGMRMPPVSWLTIVAMWWTMMIAMMLPSAAPLVLLYGRVMRHAARADASGKIYAQTLFLLLGYLGVWLAFSIIAAVLHHALQRAGLISAMMLWSRSALLSALVLIAAGLYQLSPLKHSCLTRCRGPIEYLTHHWRAGRAGAFLMGLQHGAWCVGCCGILMALLFVGGVMNLVWIALLSLLVAGEKLAAQGALVGKIAGVVLIVWGFATLMAR